MRLSLIPALLLAVSALPIGQAGAATLSRGDLAPLVLGESSGKQVLLSDYRGKVVVIAFWKASCEPCKDQMSAFEDLNKQYAPEGLQVIGVDLGDSAREYGSLLRKVRRPTMVMAHDEGVSVGEAWGVFMLPNMWVVDTDGRILAHHEGYVGSELQGIFDEVRGILAARQAPAAPAVAPTAPAAAQPAPVPADGTPR
jgi:peroxiredoxin